MQSDSRDKTLHSFLCTSLIFLVTVLVNVGSAWAQGSGIADSYRQAAARYRQAAASAPAEQRPCYNTWANYYDCLASQLVSGSNVQCTQPTCAMGASGSNTESRAGSASSPIFYPSSNATADSIAETTMAVSELIGGILSRRAERRRQLQEAAEARAAEEAEREAELDARLVERLAAMAVSENRTSHNTAKLNDAIANEMISAEIERSRLNAEIELDILRDELTPTLNEMIEQASGTGRSSSAFPALSAPSATLDESIVPENPTFADAFRKVRDVVTDNAREWVSGLVNEQLGNIREMLPGSLTGDENLNRAVSELYKTGFSNSSGSAIAAGVEKGFDTLFAEPFKETGDQLAATINESLRSGTDRLRGTRWAGALGDKIVEVGVAKTLDYAAGEIKQKLTERLGEAWTKVTGQPGLVADDPVARAAANLPGLARGLLTPGVRAIPAIRDYVNGVVEDGMKFLGDSANQMFGLTTSP